MSFDRPGSILWIARHEFRLAWRDFVAMATAGRPTRAVVAVLLTLFYVLFMHWLADLIARQYASAAPDAHALLVLSGIIALAWSLMLSQALEHVTRAFYTRSDLDLLLSSPLSARKLFAVRIVAIALGTMVLSLLLIGPFVNVLAWHGGPQWLAGYGVVVAMGSAAGAVAVLVTDTLFRFIGARRTRHAAQILAAIVGAAFVIGVQVVAIVAYGNLSRLQVLDSDWLLALAPGPDSPMWLPARALLGDLAALLGGARWRRRSSRARPSQSSRAVSRITRRPRRAPLRAPPNAAAAPSSGAGPPPARSAARNGRCCAVIRGSCRRA